MPDRKPRSLVGAVGLVLVATTTLGGCSFLSSQTTSTTPARFSVAELCSSIHRVREGFTLGPAPDLLIVQRVTGGSPRLFHFGPRVHTGYDDAAGSALLAMCELPKLPAGILCPATADVSYRIYFGHRVRVNGPPDGTSSAEAYSSVTFNPSGCQVLHGLGPPRWIARHQDFYRQLGLAMSDWVGLEPYSRLLLRQATAATFAGNPFTPAGYQPPS